MRQSLFSLFPTNSKEFILHTELCQLAWEEEIRAAGLGVIYLLQRLLLPLICIYELHKVSCLVYAWILMPPTVYWLVTVLLSFSSLGNSFQALWRGWKQTSQGLRSIGMLKL